VNSQTQCAHVQLGVHYPHQLGAASSFGALPAPPLAQLVCCIMFFVVALTDNSFSAGFLPSCWLDCWLLYDESLVHGQRLLQQYLMPESCYNVCCDRRCLLLAGSCSEWLLPLLITEAAYINSYLHTAAVNMCCWAELCLICITDHLCYPCWS